MDRVKKMVHYWCDDIKKAGLTGKGVTVAVLDTGLAPHPDFKSRVVGWRDCIYRKEKCYVITHSFPVKSNVMRNIKRYNLFTHFLRRHRI